MSQTDEKKAQASTADAQGTATAAQAGQAKTAPAKPGPAAFVVIAPFWHGDPGGDPAKGREVKPASRERKATGGYREIPADTITLDLGNPREKKLHDFLRSKKLIAPIEEKE